jgi:hypothetical protein
MMRMMIIRLAAVLVGATLSSPADAQITPCSQRLS